MAVMAVMAAWAAVLMTYGVSFAKVPETGSDDVLPLDMAPNSVDDMYAGCKDEMLNLAESQYLQNEKNKNEKFKNAWDQADKYYNNKWKKGGPKLKKILVIALYVYTFGAEHIHDDFNNAVRTQKSEYKTTFRYHALHFFLTDALQTLNARKPEAERCLSVYRRVDKYFSQDVLNKEIRFGSFTSSSMGQYPKKIFGDKSCFEIETCWGADISLYSKFENEAEVLIPPYEVFKVTKIEKRSNQQGLPCEVVYKVKSTQRVLSNTNCVLQNKQSQKIYI